MQQNSVKYNKINDKNMKKQTKIMSYLGIYHKIRLIYEITDDYKNYIVIDNRKIKLRTEIEEKALKKFKDLVNSEILTLYIA